MSIFLTGGTGFIGSKVVRYLCGRGESLHLLVRKPEKLPLSENGQIRVFKGDLRNRGDVVRAMRGTARAIHLGSHVAAWAADPADFHQVNVLGSRNVFQAALELGLERVVYTSSFSAVWSPGDRLADESCLRRRETVLSEYGHSKIDAEAEGDLATQRGLPLVTVYPTRVFGVGKLSDANAAGRVWDLYMRGRFPFRLGRGEQYANWVDAEDVARGVVLAAERGRPGERYILGGDNLTVAEVFDFIDTVTGRRHLKINIPPSVALAVGGCEEWRAGIFSSRARITRGWVEMLLENTRLSSAKASEELGYRITPWHDAVARTVHWLGSVHAPAR
jgi:nucleoside-diphosphate-sugar epimerase